jgi:Pyridoxamine 5'-phosphate oxidase
VSATLPPAVHDVFGRFVTCELTTVDSRGRPITWPVAPFYRPGDPAIRVTTGLGYPKKAHDARRNPKVALLFSDPTGSDLAQPPMVLVQGHAEVDDDDLEANRERYARDTEAKPTGSREAAPPGPLGRRFDWYFTRIYLHVVPERVLVWRAGDPSVEPEVIETGDVHDPDTPPPAASAEPGPPIWSGRIADLGRRHESAVLSSVGADGFPLAVRVPVSVDRRGRTIRVDTTPAGIDLLPGPACVTAHDHHPKLRWMRNFQVRGDLVHQPTGVWVVVPTRVVDGFELPPTGALTRAISNYTKIRRFRRTAKRERARRGPSA